MPKQITILKTLDYDRRSAQTDSIISAAVKLNRSLSLENQVKITVEKGYEIPDYFQQDIKSYLLKTSE